MIPRPPSKWLRDAVKLRKAYDKLNAATQEVAKLTALKFPVGGEFQVTLRGRRVDIRVTSAGCSFNPSYASQVCGINIATGKRRKFNAHQWDLAAHIISLP